MGNQENPKREKLLKAIELHEQKIIHEKNALAQAKEKLVEFDQKRLYDVLMQNNLNVDDVIEMLTHETEKPETSDKNGIENKAAYPETQPNKKEVSRNEDK